VLTLKKIAITGGIASGKSSVCHFLQILGASVVSADIIVHELLSPHTPIGGQVVALLGKEILSPQGIDRQKIAAKVFKNETYLLKPLEDLLHPAVQQAIEARALQQEKANAPLFVAEIPLLFETGGQSFFSETVLVLSKTPLCRQRFQKRGHGLEEYDRRMKRFLPREEACKMADHILHNDGTLDELEEQVQALFLQWT
jgi:dephospho-CoA kinase